MFLCRVAFLLAAVAGVAFAEPDSGPDKKKEKEPEEGATILAPKADARVGNREEVRCKLKTKAGWPVVLVQPASDGEPWYVQPAVQKGRKGEFSTRAFLGDKTTKAGDKFVIIVIVAKDRKHAATFKAGANLTSLPADLPRSKPITVVRGE
jgi:hypothetical protein